MADAMVTAFDFSAELSDGRTTELAQYRGQVLLVVNTASACGFTPQLTGLQALHERYAPAGLVVLAFPCNQFGSQEPGSNDRILAFCQRDHGVTFPVMAKVDVNGQSAHPLWQWLTTEAPGLLGTRAIKWNFTKFLVGRNGQVIQRYAPQVTPAQLSADIEAALRH